MATTTFDHIARSMQVVLEEVLIEKADYLYERTKMSDLCMAGGVALNCLANGQILRRTPFKRLYVQPAANDAGRIVQLTAEKLVEGKVFGWFQGRMEFGRLRRRVSNFIKYIL